MATDTIGFSLVTGTADQRPGPGHLGHRCRRHLGLSPGRHGGRPCSTGGRPDADRQLHRHSQRWHDGPGEHHRGRRQRGRSNLRLRRGASGSWRGHQARKQIPAVRRKHQVHDGFDHPRADVFAARTARLYGAGELARGVSEVWSDGWADAVPDQDGHAVPAALSHERGAAQHKRSEVQCRTYDGFAGADPCRRKDILAPALPGQRDNATPQRSETAECRQSTRAPRERAERSAAVVLRIGGLRHRNMADGFAGRGGRRCWMACCISAVCRPATRFPQ